jgi:hypothetical protein
VARIKLPFIDEYIDRHGKVRRYFRRKGARRVALPGLPGSAEFMAAYQAALDGAAPPAVPRHAIGTFGALTVSFFQSIGFANLALRPLTQALIDGSTLPYCPRSRA